jgi:hypothetical protein
MTANRRPAVIVTVDHERGLALLRGRLAQEAAYAVSPDTFAWAPMRCRSGGWLVPAAVAADIAAWGQQNRELVVVHRRKESP